MNIVELTLSFGVVFFRYDKIKCLIIYLEEIQILTLYGIIKRSEETQDNFRDAHNEVYYGKYNWRNDSNFMICIMICF